MLDHEKIYEVKELLGERFEQLLANYVEDSYAYIRQINAGHAAVDIELVRSAAHPLKSSSANVGFKKLGDEAAKIEMCAASEKPLEQVLAEIAVHMLGLSELLAASYSECKKLI